MSKKAHGKVKSDINTKPIRMKGPSVAVKSLMGNANLRHFEAPEQTWADLDDIYQTTAMAIVETGRQINTAISVPGVRDCVENKTEFNDAVAGLTRDLNTFTDQLIAIKKKHEGRTGALITPEDNTRAITIFEEYVQLSLQFKAITLPTVLTIMDHISQSYNTLAKQLGVVEKAGEKLAEELDQAATETVTAEKETV